jgi:hypothetical protein
MSSSIAKCLVAGALTVPGADAVAACDSTLEQLHGTWTLAAADKILPDGTVTRDYGNAPKGLLIVDASGKYSLQIFKSERAQFAAADKASGTPDEFRSAVLGSSTHYGSLTIDQKECALVFHIAGASFPNWEGTVQRRTYELHGDELSYRVPSRADGSVPISIWHRLHT